MDNFGNKSIGIYGRPKIGKSVDIQIATGGKAFTILSEPGGLDGATRVLGFEPEHILLQDVDAPYVEARKVLTKVKDILVRDKKWKSVIFDTISTYAERVLIANLSTMRDTRQAYTRMEHDVLDIVQRFLFLPNVWLFGIFHEQSGRNDEHGVTRGGPAVPGRFLYDRIVAKFSMMLRAWSDGTQRLYECDPLSNQWSEGDRFGVAQTSQEMDLRPLLFKILNPGVVVPDFPPKFTE